ncbi:MAG: DUF2062 domain-containing protein [Phycisphaerae bacterium]
MSRYWFRLRRFLAQRVLHTNDTPHKIALGAGLATLVAFLPLVGAQTVIAVGLAALFRANKAICIPIVWITNPFTIAPVYGACLVFGRFVMGSSSGADPAVVISVLEQQPGGPLSISYWLGMLHQLADIGLELTVGCAIVGVVGGLAAYVVVRRGVSSYRERRRQKLLRRSLRRLNTSPPQVVRRSEPT